MILKYWNMKHFDIQYLVNILNAPKTTKVMSVRCFHKLNFNEKSFSAKFSLTMWWRKVGRYCCKITNGDDVKVTRNTIYSEICIICPLDREMVNTLHYTGQNGHNQKWYLFANLWQPYSWILAFITFISGVSWEERDHFKF